MNLLNDIEKGKCSGTEGVCQCKQWEFDRHCSQNPDPRYPIDINSLVWESFIEEMEPEID